MTQTLLTTRIQSDQGTSYRTLSCSLTTSMMAPAQYRQKSITGSPRTKDTGTCTLRHMSLMQNKTNKLNVSKPFCAKSTLWKQKVSTHSIKRCFAQSLGHLIIPISYVRTLTSTFCLKVGDCSSDKASTSRWRLREVLTLRPGRTTLSWLKRRRSTRPWLVASSHPPIIKRIARWTLWLWTRTSSDWAANLSTRIRSRSSRKKSTTTTSTGLTLRRSLPLTSGLGLSPIKLKAGRQTRLVTGATRKNSSRPSLYKLERNERSSGPRRPST